ncbi:MULTISPECIES: hypothetical protein [Rhodobacterales]|jgi:hypothetical protein|uniref:Uncharacterized protein n=2 Tax=Roseobacteraceae TaxID=2854170 RepID=A0A9Q2NZ88_9RHOB|nr:MULTISPECIES: hypothetical protein [Rhodobacterales]MBM1222770.1 hypothetical protein [Ponticoccus sp. SC6-9]MBM1227394.1 hypothetical protein [Ponticoccus sp. SC6-15]MBM1231696.1 hypothetical protein [Ponticoccus sp. SC6-38]MBM1236269.1 hypothetical protein [Ponticoccus sp. SC6-45]MBM1240719.1 hypothetical protein [Ponticoccus sp. SC6-49]MBM1245254.1 hypothetical protein [Ponticoccus sp. SC2-64]MBM1249742.1 hypothetical protein [Ponticoccus sp. SC6-42]MBM1254211.1 hypothetical protein [
MSAPNNTPDIQAARILDALTALYPDASGQVADLMEYALCDLRHLADQHVICFGSTDQKGYRTYLQEKAQ